jgi:hypothetical protein
MVIFALLQAKIAAAFVFELLAYMSESAVFIFLGIAVFSKVDFELLGFLYLPFSDNVMSEISVINQAASSAYRGDTIFWTLFLCTIGRAAHVYPLLDWVDFII